MLKKIKILDSMRKEMRALFKNEGISLTGETNLAYIKCNNE